MPRALLVAVVLAGTGCTLLVDYSADGLNCDKDNQCLEGYVCDALGKCVLPAQGACRPACGPYEKCVRQQCVRTCEKRPCGAGQRCNAGECLTIGKDRQLGAPCNSNDDCSAPAFCLRAYGGESGRGDAGMCTIVCQSDASCGGHETTCVPFPSSRGAQLRICAPPTFLPCRKESDCADAGLSCGVYAVTQPTKKPLLACRLRIKGKAIGELCSSATNSCATGLCVRANGLGSETCVTPCGAKEDCEETMKDKGADCLEVTLASSSGLPKLRPQLCVPGGQSEYTNCAESKLNCHADAPECTRLANGDEKCTSACGESGEAGETCTPGLTCDQASGRCLGR